MKKEKDLHTANKSSTSRKSEKIRIILLALFSAVLLFSAIMVIKTLSQGIQEETAFKKLADSVEASLQDRTGSSEATDKETDTLTGGAEAQSTPYAVLYEQNHDFAGWLMVPDTNIDYPVMYTPDEPDYYLHRAFDGSDSISGTPFIGDGGTIDSECFIIYSHNMKNDTMFGTLDKYSDEAFFQTNPTFTFTTLTETRTYEVFAAVKARILSDNETGFRYYDSSGDLSKTDFNELLAWLKDNSLYDSEINPDDGDQILLLSTCSYHTDNGRFVVAARRIDNK